VTSNLEFKVTIFFNIYSSIFYTSAMKDLCHDRAMIRWICGAKLEDEISSAVLQR